MKYKALIICILVASSCYNDQKQHPDIPAINLEGLWDSENFIRLSEVARSIEYIPLEKTPECILPGEDMLAVKIIGRFIIVRTPKQPIYVFNRRGTFLFGIGEYGQGPGEFIDARIEFDASNKLFWILDSSQKKLLKFDESGIFLDEYKLSSDIKRIAVRSDGQVYVLRLPYRLQPEFAEVQILDLDGQIIDRIPLYQEREPGAGDFASITAFFGFYNDTLHFNEGPYRNGYFLNNNKEWEEAWSMNQGKIALEKEAYYGTAIESFLTGPSIVSVQESFGYYFIYGRKEGLSKYFVYFKNLAITKSNHILAETSDQMDIYGLFNNVDGGLPFWPSRFSSSEELVQINDAQRYIDLVNGHLKYYGTDQRVPISPELQSFCNELDPSDNPVVMVVNSFHRNRKP